MKKLTKVLTIGGKAVELNTDQVRLALSTPGRAAFTVNTTEPLKGLVVFSLGYDPQNLVQYFCGMIENSFQIDKKQQSVFCREYTAVLNHILPLSLRNVSLNQVLAAISQETGLQFVTPGQDYTIKKAPAFISMGNGYHVMDTLARIYRIPRMIWQQQGDGKVYVGSWDHSYWAGKAVELPVEMQASTGVANSAKIPAMPLLRPGVDLGGGRIATNVGVSDAFMEIDFESNPWGNRWINKSTVL